MPCLFDLWVDQPHRPTRDIDLLGFGSAGLDHLIAVFRDVCGQPCEDGIIFDQASVRVSEIRKEANYGGIRITLLGVLDSARCAVQVDVGYCQCAGAVQRGWAGATRTGVLAPNY